MHWLLPLSLVLFVALLLAAIHFVFTLWLTRQPEPATVRESETPPRTEQEQ